MSFSAVKTLSSAVFIVSSLSSPASALTPEESIMQASGNQINTLVNDEKLKTACYFWQDGAFYDLTKMTKLDTDYNEGRAVWNFCKYAELPSSHIQTTEVDQGSFAYVIVNSTAYAMTNGDIVLDEINTCQDCDPVQVTIIQKSDNVCVPDMIESNNNETSVDSDTSQTRYYSLETTIECEPKITGQGQAQILSVDYQSDPCTMQVRMLHASGCPKFSTYGFTQFLIDYPWVLGIVYLLLGPIMALYGKRLFPQAIGFLVFIVIVLGILMLFQMADSMQTTLGKIVCATISVILGLVAADFTRVKIRFAITMLGCIAGWYVAELVYISVFLGFFQIISLLAFALLVGGCILLIGFLSFKCPKQSIVATTSGVGSYLVIRGLSSIFGGYPYITEIIEDLAHQVQVIEVGIAFWIYLSVFVVFWIFAMIYQTKRAKYHPSIIKESDKYEKV